MNKWKKLVKEREISPERGMGETGTARQIMEKTGVSCAAVPRFYHMDSVLVVIKKSLLFDSRAQYYRKCWVF